MNELILYPNDEKQIPIETSIFFPEQKALLSEGDANKNKERYFINKENEIAEYSFEEGLSEFEKTNYIIAAGCGLFSGLLNVLWSKDFDLEDAHNFGKEKVEKMVCKVASKYGYKGDNLNGAIKKLEELFPSQSDKYTNEYGGGLQHHLRDFSHHPSVLGLLVSILMQFGIGIGTDKTGAIKIVTNIEDKEFIGKNFGEKIFNGSIKWMFHLISDMAGSSSSTSGGTGIPGPILSMIKELSSLPIFREIKVKYKNDDIGFSVLISKLFNGTYFKDENGKPLKLDFRTEIGLLSNQSKSVIVNECLVRAIYSIRALYREINTKNIKSLSELDRVNVKEILPIKNKILNRMLTISSGVFVLVDLSKAFVKSKGNKVMFFININYVGLGRFIVACINDFSFYLDMDEKQREELGKKIFDNDTSLMDLKILGLNEQQSRILSSLELDLIKYDIAMIKNKEEKEVKEAWSKEWQNLVLKNFNAEEDFFIGDRNKLYEQLEKEFNNSKKFYLLVLELYSFEPYFYIEKVKVKGKKSKVPSKYFKDIFEVQQKCIKNEELKNIYKKYDNYSNNVLQNKKRNKIIASSVVVATTAATSGLGFLFAPEIAVALAGPGFAGLTGAALTNASLAAIGGGSLAVGGLGMAGGTAVLTGGGALLGLASSGVTTAVSILNSTSDQSILNECAKLLTYSELVLSKEKDLQYLKIIKNRIDNMSDILNQELLKNKNNKNTKSIKTRIKYLEKSSKELEKMIDDKK